jgi:hypothetical protein
MIRQLPRRLWTARVSRWSGRLYTTTSTTSSTAPSTSTSTYSKPASSVAPKSKLHDLTSGLLDPLPAPNALTDDNQHVDWSRSFAGLSTTPFSPESSAILMEPILPVEVEVKPDGIIYLPEIKYRRILNKAFGPGAWGLAPRGETIITPKSVTREYGLVVQGRYVLFHVNSGLLLSY